MASAVCVIFMPDYFSVCFNVRDFMSLIEPGQILEESYICHISYS